MIIAVDFDGTLADHIYPEIGEECRGATSWLKRFTEAGARLILLTMRGGKALDEAVDWLRERGVKLWAVNENPEQRRWTESPKVFAHIYIDDAAFGVPLVDTAVGRKAVDWDKVGPGVMRALEMCSQ